MGYCVYQKSTKFFIENRFHEKALLKIKELFGTGPYKGRFSWLRNDNFDKIQFFDEILEAWRWTPTFDIYGNIIDLCFNGEKLGDDFKMFEVIAKYVKDGSYIEMCGEDGYVWRWVFKDRQVKELKGKVVFEE